MNAANHKTLLEALLAVQAEAPTLPKDATNPHFKSSYTPLDTIVETIGPILVKHGLVWMTMPCRDEQGDPALRYRLIHAATGETIEETMPLLLVKHDPQGLGSALTYGRRYSLSAVLNLVADDDDDGNTASRRQENGGQSRQATAAPVQPTERLASAKQRGLINARASEASMPSSVLANVVLFSVNGQPREFASEEAAQQWLKRALDRLPANRVDAVLENIKAEAGVA